MSDLNNVNAELTNELAAELGTPGMSRRERRELALRQAAQKAAEGVSGEAQQQAWTSCDEEPREKTAGRHIHERRRVVQGLGTLIRDLFNLGNRNRFEVRRNDELLLEVPVTVLVLLLIFAFWVCIPLLVIGLFAGCRYAFSGEELGRESVNSAMNKAADMAEKVKEEVTGEH